MRRMAGALVAVVVGIALVLLALLLLLAGRPIVPDRFAAATVAVEAPESRSPAEAFPPTVPWSSGRADDLARRLSAVPGVVAAVPDRSFYAQALIDGRPPAVEGQRQDTYEGHGWSSARLGGLSLVAGAEPRRPGEVVLDRALGFEPGDGVTLLTAKGPVAYTVAGLVDASGYLVADAVAAQLAPGVRTIGVVLRTGTDPERVAAAARDIVGAEGRVLVGDERGALEPRDDARARWIGMQVLTGVSALAAFVTVFVIASTFAFSVAQRRRELGLLRAIGATPRQIRRMVYGEAVLVGGVGAVLGSAVGAAAAPAAARVMVAVGLEPATYEVRYSLLPFVVALALGPVVAMTGAWSAARRAARVRPLEALREAAVERRRMGRLRWIAGGLLTVLGIMLAIGTATADDAQAGATFALYGAMVLVTGMVALAPAVVPLIAGLWRLPLRRGGGAIGLLVREGALTAARRTASTAAPVLLTVAFAVLVAGMVRTTTAAYAAGRAAGVDAGQVLVPDRTPGLSDAAVAAVPGTAMLPTTVFAPEQGAGTTPRAWSALGVDVVEFARTDRGARVIAGAVGDVGGADAVVVTESVHRTVGDLYPAVFADGELVPLRVVAVVADRSVRADLLLSRETVRRHDPSTLTSAVYLPRSRSGTGTPQGSAGSDSGAASPGASGGEVAGVPPGSAPSNSGVASPGVGGGEVAGVPPGLGGRVVDVATWAAEADSSEDRLVWLFTLMLIGVSAGYGAIAVANTLLMAAQGRAADLRVMRLAGATRRQVVAYVAAESALVVLIGAVLGGAVAFGALVSIRAGLSQQVGAAVKLVVPWSVLGGVVGLCLLLALLAGVLPTRRVLRDRAIRVPS